jgi:succinate-acetate transporter protein
LFWLTLVGLIVFPKMGWGEQPGPTAMAAYLGIWGLFTLAMFFGTLKMSRALQFVFLTLALLFFLLAIGDATQSAGLKRLAGYEGMICGLSAIYTALAQVLNEVHGRILLPLGVIAR